MTVYRMNMTVGTGEDARDVTVEVEANSPDEAVAALGTRGVRVNEHGATFVSPLSADVSGGTVYNEWKVNKVTPSKAKVTTEFAARQLDEMREKVKAGPDHGVTQAQAEELLEGMTAEQIREVAARGPLPAGYQQKSKTDLVRHTVSMTVGSALNHHAMVGYPDQGIAPEWTQSDANDSRRSPMVADRATAVRWTDPDTGTRHVGVVRDRDNERGTATVEWDNGRVEQGVPYMDRNVTFLPPDHPDAQRAQAEATQRAEDRARENERLQGTSFPERKDPMDGVNDPFNGDVEGKRDAEARIRETIKEKLNDGRSNGAVSMVELREALPDLPREQFDAAASNVFQHSDVYPDPLRSERNKLGAHFEKATDEEKEAGLQFGGSRAMSVRMDDQGRNLLGDAQRWRAADRDSADSYFATCDERQLRRLAEEFGLDTEGTQNELRDRLTEHAARNQRESSIRAHEEQEDLTVLHDAEKAMDKGYGPETWTEEERARVGAAARRQQNNEWEPGRARAAAFEGLPEDGTLGPKWSEIAKDREEIREAKKEARDTGQAYIDHTVEGAAPCAAGRRHAGPCTTGAENPEHTCVLCGGDYDLVDMTSTFGGHMCSRCVADRAVYAKGNFKAGDMTGIPAWVEQRCDRCRKPMMIRGGTQHFDADGGASVSTYCENCRIESSVNWVWSTGEAPAADTRLCEECGNWPEHAWHCPLKGQADGVVRFKRADDGVTVYMVRDEHGYAVRDDVCGHVTSAGVDDRDDLDTDFEHHVGWHNAEHAREINRGKGEGEKRVERTSTADDGVTISLYFDQEEGNANENSWRIQDDPCGIVVTIPGAHDRQAEQAFENHVALHNGRAKEAQERQAERDAERQPYAGTAAELELNYDGLVAKHKEMSEQLSGQIERREAVTSHMCSAADAVDGMEVQTGELREAAKALTDAMNEAKLDSASLAGAAESAEALSSDDVTLMLDAVDICIDLVTDGKDRVINGKEAIDGSLVYIEATYGALAAGVQELGVRGAALEGEGGGGAPAYAGTARRSPHNENGTTDDFHG
jgi:hypothetical protein